MTTQASDRIWYMGGLRPLYSDPMNRDLLAAGGLSISTANHRGYVANWKIDDGELFLVDFEYSGTSLSIPIGDLPVRAEWFSGELRVQDGNTVRDVPDEQYGATYQRQIVLEVERGTVVSSKIVEYQPSRFTLWKRNRLDHEAAPTVTDSLRDLLED